MLDLLSRLPRRLLLLKALSKKEILVPAYTRADGTYVPAHYKHVNYNADVGAVLSGKSSHSHKAALKKLSKVKGFKDLPAHEQHAHVLSSAQNIQTAASKAAQVSVFKKELLAGKKPKAANIAAFKELLASDPKKAVEIRDSIIAAIGMDKFLDLVGLPPEQAKPAGPTKEELAIATEKLIEIGAGAPGKKVGQQAYKLLEKDPEWVKKNAVDRLQAVVDKWKELQDAATFAAKVSTLTGKLAAGKVPSPSELKAYQALDPNAKLKAAQTAIKKSGGKQSFASLAKLMEQAEAKAGITVDKPEKVSLKEVASNFGHQHEGQVVGVPGKQAKFKFADGKWSYWTGDDWNVVKSGEWLASLDQGLDVLSKQPLEVVGDPSGKTSFGAAHPGQEFDCSKYYTVKWSDGAWQFRYKTKDGKPDPNGEWHSIANSEMVAALDAGKKYGDQGQAVEPLEPVGDSGPPEEDDAQWVYNDYDEAFSGCPTLTVGEHYIAHDGAQFEVGTLGTDDMKHYSAPQRVQAYLQEQGVNPPTLKTLEKMQADAETGPSADDSAWSFNAADDGFGGDPTLTMDGPDGLLHVITYSSMDDHFQVGVIDPDGDLDFETYSLASEVIDHLKQKGMHPPSEKTLLEKLVGDFDTGPHEGDTKQGVGGILTLKDGHWTLNNAAMVSFFKEHAIKPGSATAIAVTMAAAGISKDEDVLQALANVKKAAKADGYSPAQINDIIIALNSVHSEVLDYTDPFGDPLANKPSGVAEADAAGFEPDVNTPEAPDSGYSYASYLTNTSEGHNKFWAVEVDPEAKTATTTWGKIGAKKPQSKTYKHSSAQAAYQAAKDAVAAKLGKGYVSKTVLDGGGTPLPPPPAASAFKPTVGHVYSGTMSTGATMFFKFNGGHSWSQSWDPKDGWDPVPVNSHLHDSLKQGKTVGGQTLLELGPEKPKFAFEPGQVFEAGYSASSSKKMTFKYVGDGVWEHPFGDGWTPVTTAAWIEALNSGKGLDGKPIAEVASSNNGFGAKNAGKVFVAKAPGGTFQVLFQYSAIGQHWQMSTDDGSSWQPVQAGTVLADQLEKGVDGSGKPLQLHTEDAYGNPQEGASAVDDGPHEGDLKWGVNGWLILKNGHWVKATLDQALIALCPIPEAISSSNLKNDLATIIGEASAKEPVSKAWKKVATTKGGMPNVNLTIAHGGKYTGYAKKEGDKWVKVVGMAGHNVAHALNFLEHASKVEKAFLANKKLPEPLTAAPAAAPAVKPAPAAPAAAPAAPVASGGLESIDGWKKVGEQGGFNPGGTYTDPQGEEWYCKFPAGGAKVARNELLANKLYAAAGLAVPEVKLVTQNGKIGLASKIVTNAKQDKAALQSGKGEGLLSGFVADAWLANWDVVGNNPAAGKGWDNILFKQGVAYRIDPGGALLYGGAGGKKTKFGDQVIELDTMRDASINARTAKVFGGISQADLKASAAKVLEISDAKIQQMVEEFGPGDAAEKAALAKTLIARKADIAAKFPAVAKKIASSGPVIVYPHEAKEKKNKLDPTKLPVKPSDLPAPHDFMNWNNTGKPISDKPYVQQNIIDEKAIFDFALKGNLVALKDYKFQPVDKMTGEAVGAPKPMEQHPSQYVRQYYDSVVQYLEVVANPMAPLELPIAKNVSTVEQLSECFPAFKYGKSIASVPSNHRLGFWFGLGFVEDPQAVVPKVLKKTISQSAFDKAVAVWKKAPQIMRAFLKDVKGSGSANQPYRDGKVTDHGGRNCREVLRACYDNAVEHEEGTTIYKSIKMPKAMVDEFLKQPVGLVFQNPGSMCCSRKVLNAFGEHKLRIHYAKGAKANDNMGWGTQMSGSGSDSEQEITSLAGARFMVMSRQMVNGHLDMDLLMLPPDPTYVADLKESA